MAPLRRVAALAAAALCGCAVQVLETAEYAESFSRGGADRVVFVGLDGDVILRGADVPDLEIRGTRRAVGATRREARAALAHAELDAEQGAAGDLDLVFAPPFELEGIVDLELDEVSTVPRELGAAVAVEEGALAISGLEGALDLETGDGDIEVDDAGEEFVRAITASGDLRYAAGLVGFYVTCAAPNGSVEVDPALIEAGAVRHTEADGVVVLTYGDTLKRVELTAEDGDIYVSLRDAAR